MLAWFYWDPPRELFRIPYLDHPIVFYGLWFVAGFMIGFFILMRLLAQKLQTPNAKQEAAFLTDRLTWFVVLGTLIGARLGHVFFYD
jgi:prolipoprotein diacylglyceryltransferase